MKRTVLAIALLSSCAEPLSPSPLPELVVPRVAPSAGCLSPTPTSGSMTGTIQMPAGFAVPTRGFRVDAPPWWDGTTPIPIVYYFHGCGGSEQSGAYNGLYYRSAQAQWLANGVEPYDALVVVADSAGSCWDVAPTAEDLPYLQLLRSTVEDLYCVDEERRYHGGISSGAFAAEAFACRMDGVAATFGAAGGMHHEDPNPYGLTPVALPTVQECNGPVPTFLMHGTSDTTVPIDVYGRPARDRWLAINGCDPQSGTTYELLVPSADGAAAPDPGTVCEGLPDCSCVSYSCTGAPLVWCEHSGAHLWPPYHRDGAVNWLGQFVSATEPGGTGTGTGTAGASSDTGAPTSSSSSADSSSTCEMVCQCI